jgi:hypothetical protein
MRRYPAGIALLFGLVAVPSDAGAVQLADGSTHFVQPPRLEKAIATFSVANSAAATYYFTIVVPSGAGEALQRVTIAQESGSEAIAFQSNATEAFEGDRARPGTWLTVQTTVPSQRSTTGAITVAFAPAIAPGKTVTIGLRPVRNPSVKGTYFFGVTAFPAGEKAVGQPLGLGRFQFRRRGGV